MDALWISPYGEYIHVSQDHALTIQQDPDIFNLTKKAVKHLSIADLQKIAQQLIKQGWIRYRYKAPTYQFEINKLNSKNLGIIEDVLVSQEAYPFESVVVDVAKPRQKYSGTVVQFYDRGMFRYYIPNPPKSWRIT